jgi:hypothetical protein
MASIYRNIFSRGLTGALHNPFVAHQTHAGKTILTHEPMFDDHRGYIESLKVHQAAILEATTYAHFAKTQDAYLQKELETGMTAYYLAVSDWFGAPKVLEINVDRWTGEAGQTIRVKARDNVMVARVAVVIRNAEGTVLETGEAVQSKTGNLWWAYTTQTPVFMDPFPTVQAVAQDLPGNSDAFTIN